MAELRSRGGCINCRKRRRKCSEDRPRCKACVQRNVSCEYNKRLHWAVTTSDVVAHGVRPQTRRHRAARAAGTDLDLSTPTVSSVGSSSRLGLPDHGSGNTSHNPLDHHGEDKDYDYAVFNVPSSPDGGGFIRNAVSISPHNVSDGQSIGGGSVRPTFEQDRSLHERRGDIGTHTSSPTATSDHLGGGDGGVVIDVTSPEGMGIDGWELNDGDFLTRMSPDLFSNAGERIAFAYWLNYLSGILPALDSAANPYRKLSSLALASPVLLDTIISLATEYMYCHGRASAEVVMTRHDKAIASLRAYLASCQAAPPFPGDAGADGGLSDEQGLSPKQATLAAVLLQIANLVFIGGTGIDVHLACAMHFLQDLGYVKSPVQNFLPRLLVQRFAFIDVTTAILRRRRPHLPPTFWLFVPDELYDRTVPSFREMTGCPQPLLGFFSRVAHLAADIDEGVRDEHAIMRSASTLETDMRIYARSRVTFRTTRPTKSQHLDSLGQCFYWSAHLLLQRHIYRDPTNCPRVQHTIDNLVTLIMSMPPGCGPDSALPFPFYLSSRDAITEKHRTWVRQRNTELKQVYPSRTRDTLMALLEQIWAAVDDGRSERDALNKDTDAVIRRLEQTRDFCLF